MLYGTYKTHAGEEIDLDALANDEELNKVCGMAGTNVIRWIMREMVTCKGWDGFHQWTARVVWNGTTAINGPERRREHPLAKLQRDLHLQLSIYHGPFSGELTPQFLELYQRFSQQT